MLGYYDVVVLGDVPLTPSQVTMLTNWVTGGGNLIALRPDKQLAGLLGLTDAGTTLTNAYLKVDTRTQAGAGIVGQTIQFHGTADRYTLNGATSIATLYSNADDRDHEPGGHAPLRRLERRPGSGVHLRPRPLDRATRARATRRGRARIATASSTCARTTSSSARSRATSSPTGSTPTRSGSRRQTSSSACWRT